MPKIKYPENIQKLKEQLETGNNLVDYFFVCGIPPSLCISRNLYIASNNYLEHLNKTIKPSIFAKFPEFDNNNDTIDESIISYCFPNGFKALELSSKEPEPERQNFSIILDNNLFSSEYPQKYLTCLLFYERISDYISLAKKYLETKRKLTDNIDVKTNKKNDTQNEKFSEIKEAYKETEKKIGLTHHRNIKTSVSLLNEGTEFNIDPMMEPIKERNSVKEPFSLEKLKNVYIPKCICLVSIHPYVQLYQKILNNILDYKNFNYPKTIPLEKIITNLIIEVPIPPRGLYSINYNYSFVDLLKPKLGNESERYSKALNTSQNNSNLSQSENPPLQSTENNKLLVSEVQLQKFNNILNFNCKLEIIKHILFDSKILFFSKDLNKITDTILSFLSLIFPFKYPFQVSSLLHKTDYGILESTSPFIIGIKEEFTENFFENNDIMLEGLNVLAVDLDNNKYHLFSDEEFPDFPNKLITNLEKDIKALELIFVSDDDSKSTKKTDKDIIESINEIKEFNEQYQEKFFYFFCEILKGYEDYLNLDFFKSNDDKVTSIETLFNCDQFIKNIHSQSDIPFYTKFIKDGQLFADFIYKRMIPRNNNEWMDILIVNDYFTSLKKKAKIKGNDNIQNEYKINNKYIVDGPRELIEKEITDVLEKNLKLCKSGNVVAKKNIESNNGLLFDYILFPELDFTIYCNNDNVNQYIPPPDYSEEIDAINSDVISKSSLGQNLNRTMEMKNYIYLTWLEIWAFTFQCNEQQEKFYRFDQMLDVLDKVIHHEMNILNLMFDTLNKYGQPQMLLKLYQKLLQLKINPSTFIYDIISNILDKKQIKNLLDEMKKKKSSKKLKFNNYNIKNFRQRTFLSIDDNLPLETKPKFYYDYNCISCSEEINLYSICKYFEGIRNDILWVKCKKCGEYNLPKIQVKFGLDYIITHNRFSSIEDFVLHSPYNLKINMKNAVVTQSGTDIKISNFKSQFQALFWNFIWYCVIQNLDFNILLPYCSNVEQYTETNCYNPNREIFDVRFDSELFEENENKIKAIISNKPLRKMKSFKSEDLQRCRMVIIIEILGSNKPISNVEKKENEGNKGVKENKENKENIEDKNGKEGSNIKHKCSMQDFFFKGNDTKKEEKKEEKKDDKKKEEVEEGDDIDEQFFGYFEGENEKEIESLIPKKWKHLF